MKIINVLNEGDIAATLLVNDDQVGITLLALKNAVHPATAEYISFDIASPDEIQNVITWLSGETQDLADNLAGWDNKEDKA
jgi:hypothetical protein